MVSDDKFEVREVPVPQPRKGQVLIRMECAPLNPSDTYLLRGFYAKAGQSIDFPFAPGWEGAGTVVRSGGGLMAWRLVGKRVSCSKCGEPED